MLGGNKDNPKLAKGIPQISDKSANKTTQQTQHTAAKVFTYTKDNDIGKVYWNKVDWDTKELITERLGLSYSLHRMTSG